MVDLLITFIGLLATAFTVASTVPQIKKALRYKGYGGCVDSVSSCLDCWSFSMGYLWNWKSGYCYCYWQLHWSIIKHLHVGS